MATQAKCSVCGASYEDTAAGLKAHNKSQKHMTAVAVAGQQAAKKAKVAAGIKGIAEGTATADSVLADVAEANAPATESNGEAAPKPRRQTAREAAVSGKVIPIESAPSAKGKAAAKPAKAAKATQPAKAAKPAAPAPDENDLGVAKAMRARFRQYVAYANNAKNNVKPENKAKYEAEFARWDAIVAKLTPAEAPAEATEATPEAPAAEAAGS